MKTHARPFAAALLAGGDSSRMGADKAFLEDGGRPLWEVQCEKLEALDPEIRLLCVREEQEMRRPGWRRILDPPDRSGPLPALVDALDAAGGLPVLVLAVDLPRLSVGNLRQLLAMADPDREAGVVAEVDGHLQPVAALWPAEALPRAREALENDEFSLQRLARWLEKEGLLTVVPWPRADLANLNTPEDAAALLSPCSTPLVVDHREGAEGFRKSDFVAREEPLQIRVEGKNIAVVMRTPGDDEELAAGFLLSEGVVSKRSELFEISECPSTQDGPGQTLDLILGPGAELDLEALSRHVFAASSCGVCGKATIDAVLQRTAPLEDAGRATASLLSRLPGKLAESQRVFRQTGGLHACALFDLESGELLAVREDVGRHNALDKLLGWALLGERLPLSNTVLLLSGRISLEMIQKALVGGIPVVAAISAPSSLAVEFARESGQTLVGFLRGERMNVYAGALADEP